MVQRASTVSRDNGTKIGIQKFQKNYQVNKLTYLSVSLLYAADFFVRNSINLLIQIYQNLTNLAIDQNSNFADFVGYCHICSNSLKQSAIFVKSEHIWLDLTNLSETDIEGLSQTGTPVSRGFSKSGTPVGRGGGQDPPPEPPLADVCE